MTYRTILLCLALLGLSACASASGGFQVRNKPEAYNPQAPREFRSMTEPFHDVSLRGDVAKMEEQKVALVELPQPLPLDWKKEFLDPSRTIRVKRGKGFADEPHLRVVFRAALYRGEQLVAVHDAVLNPNGGYLMVLLPPSADEDYAGTSLLVLSHDAYFGMTSRGEMVTLGKQSPATLPAGFFQAHPSPLPPLKALRRSERKGSEVFTGLELMFPLVFEVNGVTYSGTKNSLLVLAELTPADQALDRVITCGSGTISFPLFLEPVSAGIQVLQNGIAATRGCYRGDRH